MFSGCSGLTSLDVSGFDTRKVTNMDAMFQRCRNLSSLDVSGFNTEKVTSMVCMFYGCSSLISIYVGGDWTTANVTSSNDMFKNCISLIGGAGTTYDSNHIDKEYAHIDGGSINPGYFSDKNTYLRGDVNGDLEVNIADVNAVIDVILGGSGNAAADVNGDGEINIADVIAIIAIILNGSWN